MLRTLINGDDWLIIYSETKEICLPEIVKFRQIIIILTALFYKS